MSQWDDISIAATLSTTFYLCNVGFQRYAALMSIHSGHPRIASVFGVFSVALSSEIAFSNAEFLSPSKAHMWWVNDFRYRSQLLAPKYDERIWLSVIAYSLLEGKSFLTASPSSVITIGAHANHGNFLGMFKGSVLSTNPTATTGQVAEIQRLGKKFVSYHDISFF